MAWLAAAFAGTQAILGYSQAKQQYKLDKIVSRSNAEVANILRESRNTVQAAAGHLNRYMQSRQNQVHLQNAGRTVEAIVANISRLQGEAVTGSLSRRIEAAEAMGAIAAQAGARGGVGSMTNAMMNSTIKLREAIAAAHADKQVDRSVSDMASHLDVERENMILGLSSVAFLDNLDYMATQEAILQKPSLMGHLVSGVMSAGKAYVGAGGTLPQIGGLGEPQGGITLNMTQKRSTMNA